MGEFIVGRQDIRVELTSSKKEKPLASELQFGKTFTDHMFIMNYEADKGWHDPRVVPYQPIVLDPAAVIFHYGQTVFEGLKAYKSEDGTIRLFRPEKNMKRINHSNERLCMPQIDEDLALDALKKLIQVDKDWIPTAEGTSLYIRPFIIATDSSLSVSASGSYQFMIILSPVGSYYKEGINPVKILVENEYIRAVSGGTGTAKTAGNYAAGLKAQEGAEKQGYAQVLWLDGVEKKYVEEVGSMNIFFKIDGEVITPALNGSILEGVTRGSIIELLNHWDMPVTERRISMEEIRVAHQEGRLEEAFGTGTAAVISPVGELNWEGDRLIVNEGKTGEVSKRLYETLTGIQTGIVTDPFGWVVEVQ